MADGKTCDTVDSVVLRIDTDEGVSGWGEVCPIPHYLPAYAGGVAPAVAELAPVLLGADPVGPEALMARLDANLPGHVYAKSAIDIALWDITGQVAGLPLYALLGGRRQARLPLYHSISCLPPDEMARIAREAQAQGMTQFQVKLGASGDWTTDVERLVKVSEAVGPGPLVYGDWNCGATTLEATPLPRGLTYAGHPLDCASGVAAIRAMQEEGTLAKCHSHGRKDARRIAQVGRETPLDRGYSRQGHVQQHRAGQASGHERTVGALCRQGRRCQADVRHDELRDERGAVSLILLECHSTDTPAEHHERGPYDRSRNAGPYSRHCRQGMRLKALSDHRIVT